MQLKMDYQEFLLILILYNENDNVIINLKDFHFIGTYDNYYLNQ